MNAEPWGWRAYVSDTVEDWASRSARLTLYRRSPDGHSQQIVGFEDNGWPIIEDVPDGAMARPGFRIPREALEALAEVIKPGPSQGEVRRLEEALAIERARVDRALGGGQVLDTT